MEKQKCPGLSSSAVNDQDSVLVPQAHGGADRGLRPHPGPGPLCGPICEHQPRQLLHYLHTTSLGRKESCNDVFQLVSILGGG